MGIIIKAVQLFQLLGAYLRTLGMIFDIRCYVNYEESAFLLL